MNRFYSLQHCHQTPLGKIVQEEIQRQWQKFDLAIPDKWLQIGNEKCLLRNSRRCLVMSQLKDNKTENIVGNANALPFATGSFSLVFLPFVLEYESCIENIINEAKRVLTDDGYLLIAGINPWSLWGGMSCFSSQYIYRRTALRMYISLTLKGFSVGGIKSFLYRPPIKSVKMLEATKFLETMGHFLWPYPGGLYLLLAQKRTLKRLPLESLSQTKGLVLGRV